MGTFSSTSPFSFTHVLYRRVLIGTWVSRLRARLSPSVFSVRAYPIPYSCPSLSSHSASTTTRREWRHSGSVLRVALQVYDAQITYTRCWKWLVPRTVAELLHCGANKACCDILNSVAYTVQCIHCTLYTHLKGFTDKRSQIWFFEWLTLCAPLCNSLLYGNVHQRGRHCIEGQCLSLINAMFVG